MPFFPHTGNTGGGLTAHPRTAPPPSPSIHHLIREAADLDQRLPPIERVHALIARLYCYISVTATELESYANTLPSGNPARVRTLAAVRSARHRLAPGSGNGYISAITYTQGLARAARQLLPHHAQLPHTREHH
ncbi:hypothetical protein I5Q34_29175 [Streptomyces sp. AV19]|uniref:DUF6415 family natural product biosynthesis protein n=1 Tax=Streptomyces sp. AV19 TaxID=2793068 RepID=UPI0018FEE672|nr:DUF6415 family natural product biosynthesis protein [Streptomyces sp. AV19]MBH1938283.1 hypothetical protein [Streptomyces sp. AV19]MDG4534913.1 DUF6415 family natural product biosynthesis protein [Streptomyces sp. AV19]